MVMSVAAGCFVLACINGPGCERPPRGRSGKHPSSSLLHTWVANQAHIGSHCCCSCTAAAHASLRLAVVRRQQPHLYKYNTIFKELAASRRQSRVAFVRWHQLCNQASGTSHRQPPQQAQTQ
jgi:hypothetical protein